MREGNKFNVQMKGLPWQGQVTCDMKRKGRVYDTGGYWMKDLRNTGPTDFGALEFAVASVTKYLHDLIPHLLQFFIQLLTSQ